LIKEGEVMTEFTSKLLEIIKTIPNGKVTTYGRLAVMAGNPRGARQVAWVLKAYSKKYDLPWHRIINSKGMISLEKGHGFELQKSLLEGEGICVNKNGSIDLDTYLWKKDF
jgi:methylated-DNA-protein-cysteine methyltransferase-like protein